VGKVAAEKPVLCYLGLGSNQGDRQQYLLRALEALRQTRRIQVRRVTSSQWTRPIGPVDQPDFLNAVAEIVTTLKPLELLDRLQDIEVRLGRVRVQHWGPRTIDLDILLYGRESIRQPRLTVPHSEIGHRPFVQQALQELGVRF
jgi:2-amino-4-hydroxy-6-hydroxymethyldihydropteridine diphosphokinase